MNITHLEDPDLDAMLRTADPVDTAGLARAAHSPAASALRGSITDDTVRAIRPHRRRFALMGAVAAAAAAAVIGTAVVAPSSHTTSAYAAGAVSFAQGSPRLLVAADGWKVSDVYDGGYSDGEIDFSLTGQENDHGPWFDVNWFAGASEHESDKQGQTPAGTATIDGHTAWVGHLPDANKGKYQFEAIWSDGGRGLTAKGEFATMGDFVAVASSLHQVDTQTFLAALPPEMVKPDARRAAVTGMLADIPQPAGFDAGPLKSDMKLLDRYQVGAQVTGAVTCGWVQQWTSGDAAAKSQASAAMATWPQWNILREMDTEGAFSEGIGEIAAYMNGEDGNVRKSGMTLQQWAGGAVGCHS